MAYSELRENDMRVEREIASWVDSHIYNKPFFSNVRRINDLESQYKGIDVVIDIPSLGLKDIKVDEKAMSHYLLRPLPTFALEIGFLNKNNERQIGWFLDETKETQYYNFLWIKSDVDDKHFTSDRVVDCKFAFISRKRLLDYLQETECGVGENDIVRKLKQKEDVIRSTQSKTGAIEKDSNKPYWFFYSTYLKEMPVNIVLRRNLLFELSDFYYDLD